MGRLWYEEYKTLKNGFTFWRGKHVLITFRNILLHKVLEDLNSGDILESCNYVSYLPTMCPFCELLRRFTCSVINKHWVYYASKIQGRTCAVNVGQNILDLVLSTLILKCKLALSVTKRYFSLTEGILHNLYTANWAKLVITPQILPKLPLK